MQHTLIPLKDRRRLHREYILRVIAVLFFGLACAVMVGVVALFPGYIRAWFYHSAAHNDVLGTKQAQVDENINMSKAVLARDATLLATVSSQVDGVMYSDLITSLVGVRGRAVITHFTLNQADPKTISIQMKGVAPTRDELIAFKGRLEALLPGNKIDIPIEQLARSTNPPFNLTFVKKLQ